jgi:hypothetical protein
MPARLHILCVRAALCCSASDWFPGETAPTTNCLRHHVKGAAFCMWMRSAPLTAHTLDAFLLCSECKESYWVFCFGSAAAETRLAYEQVISSGNHCSAASCAVCGHEAASCDRRLRPSCCQLLSCVGATIHMCSSATAAIGADRDCLHCTRDCCAVLCTGHMMLG